MIRTQITLAGITAILADQNGNITLEMRGREISPKDQAVLDSFFPHTHFEIQEALAKETFIEGIVPTNILACNEEAEDKRVIWERPNINMVITPVAKKTKMAWPAGGPPRSGKTSFTEAEPAEPAHVV